MVIKNFLGEYQLMKEIVPFFGIEAKL